MIKVRQKGSFNNSINFLSRSQKKLNNVDYDKYGMRGVRLLKEHTPKDTGKTSESWSYDISKEKNLVTISFHNSNIQNGVPIVIILQYGHATRNGGWVEGIDYINPSVRSLFNEIAEDLWKEVTK